MGQLSYFPLIWAFCSRRSNHLFHKLQERALRIAYNNFNSSFSELLEMANESTIHIRNLELLLTDVYKFLNGLSPPIMNEFFQTNDCPYDLRNPRILASNTNLLLNMVLIQLPLGSSNLAKHSLRNKKLGITQYFQIEYKTDTELIFSLQNLPFIHS